MNDDNGSLIDDEGNLRLLDPDEATDGAEGAGGAEGGRGSGATEASPRRRRSPWVKALIGLGVCLLLLAVAGVGTFFYVQHRLGGQIERIPGAFAGLENRPDRPGGEAAGALNVLLIGSDRRSDEATTGTDAEAATWLPGEQRSDTIMVLHIDADRKGASVISIPRDSWVDIPGHGSNKINAAFSLAGPSLAVATVEELTGVRIDHLAVVDWEGFAAITDELGGVTVTVPETVHDSARDVTWTAGEHHLDGEEALTYARQRYGLLGGDFDRVKRQQAFLRALAGESLDEISSKNPGSVYGLLDTLTKHLSVDEEWSIGDMRDLAWSLRSLRGGNIDYLTAPVTGTGYEGPASVVYLDDRLGRTLWTSVREDRVGAWTERHSDQLTPRVVR